MLTEITNLKSVNNIPKYTFDFYIGLCLALSSSLFIGSSFIIKKKSLKRLNRVGGVRAAAGGFGYLKDWTWWIGFLTMGIGELANFAAYAFAPASLVTPLGALSVLVSAVLASKFLNETLNFLGKMGCILCILGSTVIVIHAPKNEELESLEELILKIQDADFIYYLFIVSIMVVSIVLFLGPRYGSRYVTVYIALCSAVGSLTVMSCKALGLALRSFFQGTLPPKNIWLLVLLVTAVIVFICVQMNYLNKALDLFDTNLVTPIYYVMFTTLVIVVSAILFKEWANMNTTNILGAVCGFSITVVAIFLLSTSKDTQNSSLIRNCSNGYASNSFFPRTV